MGDNGWPKGLLTLSSEGRKKKKGRARNEEGKRDEAEGLKT